jgi:hypothetical protein
MKLRPYQAEVLKAVIESIQGNLGLTFSVEIARQGGKNELSVHLEVLLLTMFMAAGGSAIKCSPTFKPQTIISISRLKERLNDFRFRRHLVYRGWLHGQAWQRQTDISVRRRIGLSSGAYRRHIAGNRRIARCS